MQAAHFFLKNNITNRFSQAKQVSFWYYLFSFFFNTSVNIYFCLFLECPKDTYKPEHGNDTCIPCPEGSGTQNALAAKGCVCKSLTAEMIDGVCKGMRRTPLTPMFFGITFNTSICCAEIQMFCLEKNS